MADDDGEKPVENYSRREALAALMTYSAAVGGAAVPILSADEAVAQASAYPPDFPNNPFLQRFCARHPTHWICTWASGGGRGGRIRF